ncbi:MAG TPA: hypothetical protein VFZ59_02575 [Verrucomicrobiae bacterium]|nr:hypothetical protein [Verrucomicrobiae bacterium]
MFSSGAKVAVRHPARRQGDGETANWQATWDFLGVTMAAEFVPGGRDAAFQGNQGCRHFQMPNADTL